MSTELNIPSTLPASVSPARRALAKAIDPAWGMLLFLLWANPLINFVMNVQGDSMAQKWWLFGLMLLLFNSFFFFPRRYYDVRDFERNGRLYRRLGVCRLRYFMGRGEGIQRFLRWIDPQWQNPLAKMSTDKWIEWTRLAEGLHWGWMLGALPAIWLAFYTNHSLFAWTYVIANLPFNIFPIMLQRYTRAKLLRIAGRETSEQQRIPPAPATVS